MWAELMQPFEAQIWRASPSQIDPLQWAEWIALLDPSEQEQCLRLRFEADRHAYALAHTLRRLALAQALGCDPGSLSFSHDQHGKPALRANRRHEAGPELSFSHSHTRDEVIFAISSDALVGVDVETVRADGAELDILDDFLVRPGAPAPAGQGASAQEQFYFYWTALEAFWKAEGSGLSASNPRIRCEQRAPDWFEVRLEDAGRPEPQGWVVPLHGRPGSSACLAVRSRPSGAGARVAVGSRPTGIHSGEKTQFFKFRKRALHSKVTTIVSS
ncbi:MAG TPA: 4'-phosphopantetheinyl transferase superfamily protein [Polaromonas sp.]|jgi:phosphopantetheinyl transferase|nr:4'-phosphopantetheinyl transferase superfamily protein [Polaromonas sp.]